MIPEHLWFKSSRSVKENQCVEVAMPNHGVGIRDSKNPDDGHLLLSPHAWAAFINNLKNSHFD